MKNLRISLLHLAPVLGDVENNRRLVESAVKVAADLGSDWAVTPELCIPGYLFADKIGTDWILPQPDPWMDDFCRLVKQLSMTVFLAHPERDAESGDMFNTVFVIDRTGRITGHHRKVKTLRGPEAWSSPGSRCDPIECDGVRVGVLVCADCYKNDVPQLLKDNGAEILVSPASWGPGGCGPDGEWEQRSEDTGLPLIVCNRSGIERADLDFREAESVVAQHGKRLLGATSPTSVALTFDWDLETMSLVSEDFLRTPL
jgi:N-carbamoylputrescine amidase